MKTTLLHPTYFGSIAQFIAIAASEKIVFEVCDNYQKQTYRNRTYIYGANGRLLLSIPIKHSGGTGRQLYKDVKIENSFPWQQQHWRSIQTAYRTSPFFEFYEDEIAPLFEKPKDFLLDFNFECIQVVSACMQLELPILKTSTYISPKSDGKDYRFLVNSKKEKDWNLERYNQVFIEKYDFIPNLSILDLLFNEGTNALTYLENQTRVAAEFEIENF